MPLGHAAITVQKIYAKDATFNPQLTTKASSVVLKGLESTVATSVSMAAAAATAVAAILWKEAAFVLDRRRVESMKYTKFQKTV